MLQHMQDFRLQPHQCRILYAFLTRMAMLVMFLLKAHVMMATVLHLNLEFDFLPEVNVTMATLSTVALARGGILTVVLALGGILTIAIALALEEILLLLFLLLLLLLLLRGFNAKRRLDAMWHNSQLRVAIPLVKMVRSTLTYSLNQLCRKTIYL